MAWMAWTGPTATFFIAIVLMLTGMTMWELISPTSTRRGFLPLATTRGDRLFIGLLATALVHAIWLGASDGPVWIGSIIAAIVFAVIARWG